MRGRYLLRDPKKARAFALMDTLLSLAPGPRRAAPEHPKRILVANWAHLGDVLTTMGAIRTLREWFPDAAVDMLVGKWGRPAADGSGLVDALHMIDHPLLDRSVTSRRTKLQRYRETRAMALPAIRAARYDVGIDFYPYFPPAHPLFRQAGIPVRIGFDSGGFGPLLTHPVRWPDAQEPIAEHYGRLLAAAWPSLTIRADGLRPQMKRGQAGALPAMLHPDTPYIVLHPGAGSPVRNWPVEHWATLLNMLGDDPIIRDRKIVITGGGQRDEAVAAELAAVAPAARNLAGKIDWNEFVATIAGADLVVCPDTVTSHLAAMFDRPLVCLFSGTVKIAQWGPYSPGAIVLAQDLPCAPCNRWGCEAMTCIRGTRPEQVLQAMRDALARD